MRVLLPAVLMTLCFALPAGAGPKAQQVEEKQCPHAYGEFDEITADIGEAKTCAEAAAVASSCAVGGTSDQRIAGAAIARCERDFLAKLTAAQKRAYEAERTRCERRFYNKQGSMYRSEGAFCLVGVAQRYVTRFARVAPKQ